MMPRGSGFEDMWARQELMHKQMDDMASQMFSGYRDPFKDDPFFSDPFGSMNKMMGDMQGRMKSMEGNGRF